MPQLPSLYKFILTDLKLKRDSKKRKPKNQRTSIEERKRERELRDLNQREAITKMPSTPPKSTLQQLHRVHHHNANTAAACYRQSQSTVPIKCASLSCATTVPDYIMRQHAHPVGADQCCSAVVQQISAPVSTVWPVVRRFDKPQAYKNFVKSCHVITGDGDVGTLREVRVVSGLPAISSTERLEILDDERFVISFRVVGGDHRLANYRSVTTLHPSTGAGGGTTVVESYVVDVPAGNTMEDTRVFVDTIVKCNLQSLAQIAETSALRRD